LVAVFLIRRLFRGGFTDGRLPSLLIEAVKYNVLSLDDRSFERANPDIAGRQQLIRGNTELLYSAMRE
jgi:hypothetical protein